MICPVHPSLGNSEIHVLPLAALPTSRKLLPSASFLLHQALAALLLLSRPDQTVNPTYFKVWAGEFNDISSMHALVLS